jgi:deazaflavin-dependent oxidoreductase (nitroreductase family)
MKLALKDAFAKQASALNIFLFRRTGGKIGGSMGKKAKILLLTTTGRKSGQPRTVPLVYTPDGDRLVLVASYGGDPRSPAWFHNLTANPLVTVEIGSEKKTMRAEVADADEKQRLWPMVVATYKGYEGYQRKTDREIPLVILTEV